jgi:aminoglycoside phosphotransferase (APT) family kinase protein
MKYSQRLGEITDKKFQKALDRFKLGKLIKAKPVPFGNFGQNVFLKTSKGDYVFRGKPHYEWQFKSEQFMAKLLHENTKVPVPYPYLIDEKKDIFGWSYCIMPKLKGKQLKIKKLKDKLSEKDKKEIAKAFGENLAKMQKLTWKFPGQYDPETKTIKKFDKPFDKWIIDSINKLVSLCKTYNDRTTKKDIEWISRIIEEGRESLKIPFTPEFVMHDYQESNMVIDKISGRWKVTGVFDLMENYFGDGEADIPRMFVANFQENLELAYIFLNSYLSKHKVREGFEKRFQIYLIFDRLVVWEWAQRNKKSWLDKNVTFKKWCGRYAILDKNKISILNR